MVYHDTAHIFLLVRFQYDAATRALLRQGPVFVVQEGSESSDAAGQSRVIRLDILFCLQERIEHQNTYADLCV